MNAKSAKEFVDIWSQEVNRAAILWNSLPKDKVPGFREFLQEYREWIGIATFSAYGKDAVIELLNGGLDPEMLGLTSRLALSKEEEGVDVMDMFSERNDEELKKMIEAKDRYDKKKFQSPDENTKSGVV